MFIASAHPLCDLRIAFVYITSVHHVCALLLVHRVGDRICASRLCLVLVHRVGDRVSTSRLCLVLVHRVGDRVCASRLWIPFVICASRLCASRL